MKKKLQRKEGRKIVKIPQHLMDRLSICKNIIKVMTQEKKVPRIVMKILLAAGFSS
jgi:hypothetical protein